MSHAKKLNQGIALISVLLIVALTAILATKMTGKLMLQMQRTSNIENNQQAYWYAIGAEAFAQNVLTLAFNNEPDITHLEQFWAQGKTSYPVDYGQISGEIFDLQACLNLNALRAKASATPVPSPVLNPRSEAQKAFKELLLKLELDGIDEFSADNLTDALIDWLDADSDISSNGGAEDNDYSGKSPSYLAANNLIASVSELRVVEHFNADIIEALKKYVCVLPDSDLHQININTLTEEKAILLAALLGITEEEASNILTEIPSKGFSQVGEFTKLSSVSKLAIADLAEKEKQFTVDSEYFLLKAAASFNGSFYHLHSIFKVDTKENNVAVIARSVGKE